MKEDFPYFKLKEIVDLKNTIISQTSVCFSNQRILIFGGVLNKTKTNQLFELAEEKKLLKIVPDGNIPPERSSHSAIIRKVTTEDEIKETMVCET
jgi:hypothetical protein